MSVPAGYRVLNPELWADSCAAFGWGARTVEWIGSQLKDRSAHSLSKIGLERVFCPGLEGDLFRAQDEFDGGGTDARDAAS